ncbi:MAG: type I phosphomannose isomerase catalytic subunit [Candidatus Hydrothermarchaeota archaeon]
MFPEFLLQATHNLVKKPWGGRYICDLKGVECNKIGESWEFSAHPSNPSYVILNDKIYSFIDVFNEYREKILGVLSQKYDYFPILLKIIDANENLSIQVHPSEKDVQDLGENDHGKEEGWIVLDSEDGFLYLGFKRELIFDENIEKKLNKINVNKFDSFFIPSGVIHALGRGTRVIELSTNSDITYRIYDFGRGRELHLDKALKVLRQVEVEELIQKPRILGGFKRFLDTPYFTVDFFEITGSMNMDYEAFHIIFCMDGDLTLRKREKVSVKKGNSALIPASTKNYSIESDYAEFFLVTGK